MLKLHGQFYIYTVKKYSSNILVLQIELKFTIKKNPDYSKMNWFNVNLPTYWSAKISFAPL